MHFLRNLLNCFPQRLFCFPFLPAVCKGSLFSISLLTIFFCLFLIIANLSGKSGYFIFMYISLMVMLTFCLPYTCWPVPFSWRNVCLKVSDGLSFCYVLVLLTYYVYYILCISCKYILAFFGLPCHSVLSCAETL